MRIEEVVYKNRNNVIGIFLSVGGKALVAAQYAAITRCQLLVGSTLMDSSVEPEAFDLTQLDRIIIKTGTCAAADGLYEAWLMIFDDQKPLGIVVGNLAVTVKNI